MKDGFHIVVEVEDSSITFSILLVQEKSYGLLADVSLKHRILPTNGLTEVEINKITAILARGFTELADKANRELERTGKIKKGTKNKIKIASAAAIVYSPWFQSEVKGDIGVGNKGVVISKKAVDEALVYENGDRVALETFVANIKLNGYEVSDPLNKKSNDVRAEAYFYTVEQSFYQCLEHEIAFHVGEKPKIMTFPKACSLFAFEYQMGPTLFINIENETTCIVAVTPKSNISKYPTYSFETLDLGLDQIIKKVMEKSGSEKEVALSYVSLLNEDMLTTDASALIKGAYEEAMGDWREKVEITLQKTGLLGRFAGHKKIILSRDHKWNSTFGKILSTKLPENDQFDTTTTIEQVVFESSLIRV